MTVREGLWSQATETKTKSQSQTQAETETKTETLIDTRADQES